MERDLLMIALNGLGNSMNNDQLYIVENITKKGKKYGVRFSNLEEELYLLEDQIVEYRIIKGNAFTIHEMEQIKTSSEIAKYYQKVLHYIDFKPRTEKEVREYLNDSSLSENDINQIIKKLKTIHFIDDFRFAIRFTEELIRRKKGRFGIYQTLRQKGLESVYIEESLKQYTLEMERNNALEVAQKAAKLYTSYPIKKQKQQIMQKLTSAGYGQEVIYTILNQLVFETDFEERLKKEYQQLLSKQMEKEKIVAKLLAKGYEYSDIQKMMRT